MKVPEIEFFFDFYSPYAYLAYQRLPSIAARFDRKIAFRPIDLRLAKAAAGNTGPATIEMPIKFHYIMNDIYRWAEKYDAPFLLPDAPTPESSEANKAVYYAIQHGMAEPFVKSVWDKTYGAGRGLGDENLLVEVAQDMGWQPEALLSFVDSPEADAAYRKGNEQAQEIGVFGVPYFRVGNESWWGNDRLDFLEDHLAVKAGVSNGVDYAESN